MKTNKKFFTAAVFLTGLVLGISLMGLFGFTGNPYTPRPGMGINPVSSDLANSYFKQYLATAVSFNQVINAYNIDTSQLNAMNHLFKENPGLTGFRIYMGKDKSQKLSMIVGVDNKNKDAVTNTICKTYAPNDPCPPVCDYGSPIMQK